MKKLLHTLEPNDSQSQMDFGATVAVDGAYALVGAKFAATTAGSTRGAVYVFDTATGEFSRGCLRW